MRTDASTFEGADGQRLFEQHWLPEGDPRSAIVLVHGYAEHSGRYGHVAQRLTGAGHAIYALDLRGHGRSGGRRAYVRSLDEYLVDLRPFVARVREREPTVPLYLLGHSMGGTIVALSLLRDRPELHGAILSAAGLKLRGGIARVLQQAAVLVGRLAARLPLARLNSGDVSRDGATVAAYDGDPLVYRGRMRAGMAAALIRAVRSVEAQMESIDVPLLLLHGTDDALTEPEGSRELYRRARSEDKTLKLYDGLYHEVLNEPEREQVIADVVQWLDARTGRH